MPWKSDGSSFLKHLRTMHVCFFCGKEVCGNGFGNHKNACRRKAAIRLGMPADSSYREVVDRIRMSPH